jgi:PKD repeat protein
VGEPFDFSGTFTDPDGKPRYDYTWRFGDGNTSVGRTFNANRPLEVTHAFNEPGEITVTLEVTDKNGNTGSDTQIVNVRGINTDACATGVATVRSRVPWGNWDVPSAWEGGQVPSKNDWVLIKGGHNIILPNSISSVTNQLQIKGLCIEQNGRLQSAFNALNLPPSWLNIYAASIHNYGLIQSAYGVNGAILGGSYEHATAGSNIKFFVYKFINDGQILANGRGGDDKPHLYFSSESGVAGKGANGGQIEIFPAIMISNGKIQGGNGGTAEGVRRKTDGTLDTSHFVIGNMEGGHGGSVRVMATNLPKSTLGGEVIGGCGGDAVGRSTESVVPGLGGSVFVNVGTMAGKAAVCPGVKTVIKPHYQPIYQRHCRRFLFWKSCSTVQVGWRFIGWDPTLLKATRTTQFGDVDHIDIFGSENATIDLTELSEGAITAEESLTIKVGKGSVVELPPASRGQVFITPKLEIFADEIRQNGITLTPEQAKEALTVLAPTADIAIAPSKPTYTAGLSYQQHLVGEPNTTVPVKVTLLNVGPENDVYTLTVTDTAGWEMDGLPETIPVNSQRRGELEMNVKLPATRGQQTLITVTAQSQGDPEQVVEAQIRVGVIEQELITPRTQADNQADITIVIENTTQMAGDIITVSNILEDFLAANLDATEMLTIELITFKDDVKSRIVTTDIREVIGRIRSLRPSGGGDCPNASVAALESALSHVTANGQVFVVTASPPHKAAATAIAQAQQQSVKVHTIMTGTCGNEAADKALYKGIADDTGGTFQWLPKGETAAAEIEHALSTVVGASLTEAVEMKTDEDTDDDTDNTGDVHEVTPANCQLYGVHDQGLNDSIFFAINPSTGEITELGEMCEGCDIEAMAIHRETNIIYVASGNDTNGHPKGHLYKLDAETGELFSIGATGFNEIGGLTFDSEGVLWAWAKGKGLAQLDIETAQGTLTLPSKALLEDLTSSRDGKRLYGSLQVELWSYDLDTKALTLKCADLGLETEAVEMLFDGQLLLGRHLDKTLQLHALDIQTCAMVASWNIPILFNDIEGFAWPHAACTR